MSIERRLRELEDEYAAPEETPTEREERRKAIREEAERMNASRDRDGEPPLFEITEAGDVLCAHDRRPVTDFRQTLAEDFYWMEVGFGGSFAGLVHDEEAEAFYTRSGKLAVSRDHVDLTNLMGKEREWSITDEH